MNTKKLLQILEIICPFFNKVDDGNGDIDKSNPLGYAIWFPTKFAFIFKAIWVKDNEVLNVVEKLFRLCVNLVFSIAILPICLIFWVIGNLIYAINYDKHRKSKLFLAYSAMIALVLLLGIMVADYKAEGKIQDIVQENINQSVDEIKTTRSDSVRIAGIKAEKIEPKVTTIPETTTEIVTITEITTTPEVTESNILLTDGYTIQRKNR